jgi:hypothetical protein
MRLRIEKDGPNLLGLSHLPHLSHAPVGYRHNVITVFDRALTRPLTRRQNVQAQHEEISNWSRVTCLEGTGYVTIGKEFYLVGPETGP